MANLRKIRMRIKSVESTRQITRSMKMVAAAKLRKTQQAYSRLRAFAEGCAAIYARTCALLPQAAPEREESAPADEVLWDEARAAAGSGRTCYVLIVPDRGLCGTYGHALLRYFRELRQREGGESLVYVAGRWGRDQIGALDGVFDISDAPSSAEAAALTEALCQIYREGKADRIVLVFQRFRSVLSQEPGTVQLLPALPPETAEGAAAEEGGIPPILEPDGETVLKRLRELYLQSTVHSALLEARTGEHAARMTAMTAATDNTEELIGKLTLELNHARQAAITTEISEIVGGAAAL